MAALLDLPVADRTEEPAEPARKSLSSPALREVEELESGQKEQDPLLRSKSLPKLSPTEQKQIVKMPKQQPLVEYSELPEYLRDNEYIHKHYRADWPLSQTLWSVFGIHNETGNIWTHLVGFLLFVAITVYTAMKVPSAVEIPLSALNLRRLGDRLPATPSLESLRNTLEAHVPNSLRSLELPQLKQLQKSLSNLQMPQLRQLQLSLSRVELPHLDELRKNLPSVDIPGSLDALYRSLSKSPDGRNWDVASRLEALYSSLPTLPRVPHLPTLSDLRQGAQSSGASLYDAIPNIQGMQDRAEEYFTVMADRLSRLPRMGQEVVTEGLAHLPGMKDMHEAAEPYLAAVAERLSHLPNMQDVHDAAEPFFAAVSEGFSHLPKMPDFQGAAEQYFTAAAEKLSQLELLHTLHHLEMLMMGMEVSRVQEALHSLVSYYSCIMNSVMLPATSPPSVCLLEERTSVAHPPVCPVQGPMATADLTSTNETFNGPDELPFRKLAVDMTCPAPTLYSTPTVRWPLFLYLAGAMACLLLSASCHLLGCVSCEVSRIVWRFDYAGIAGLISSSFLPTVFYGFLCQPVVRTVYLSAVLAMGIATVAVSLLPTFQTPEYRHIRAGLFFGMGIAGIVPCTHKFFFYYNEPVVVTTTLLELLMGALYGLGALLYATRVPERWLPGKFDIAGHSHQLFHVLVIAGAYTHYRAGLLYLEWRDLHGCGSV